MKATGLPAPVAASVAVEPVAAAVAASQTGSVSDFVGVMMQLLGGNAAALTGAATPTVVDRLPTTQAAQDSEDPTELASMLAIALPAQMPWAALPAEVVPATDPLLMLGIGGGAGKATAEALLALKTELADTVPELTADAVGDDGNGVGSLSPFNEILQARAAPTEASAARTLHSPVGSQQWADELSTRMTLMVDRGQQSASLRLSPEHLGPLEVRISITDDKASVWFGAAHADTRAAIEHALPRLREMFSSQGLSLADAGVFREPPRDQPPAPPRSWRSGEQSPQQEGEVRIATRNVSLFDAYA